MNYLMTMSMYKSTTAGFESENLTGISDISPHKHDLESSVGLAEEILDLNPSSG